MRVWEDCTKGNEVDLGVHDILDVREIYTLAEVTADQHLGNCDLGVRSTSWDACVEEGFVDSSKQKRRRFGESRPKSFKVTHSPWSKEGTPDDPLFVLRRKGFHLNHDRLLFCSAPITMCNDAFNAWGMKNKVGLRRVTATNNSDSVARCVTHPKDFKIQSKNQGEPSSAPPPTRLSAK